MFKITKNFLIIGFLPLLTLFLFLFNWTLPKRLHATMKLKKVHVSVKLTCKNCHHKPQKKCSHCHMENINIKISSLESLPDMAKKVHAKCHACHSAKGMNNSAQIGSYVKSSSKCKLCH